MNINHQNSHDNNFDIYMYAHTYNEITKINKTKMMIFVKHNTSNPNKAK